MRFCDWGVRRTQMNSASEGEFDGATEDGMSEGEFVGHLAM
jgi:hypothetical protein